MKKVVGIIKNEKQYRAALNEMKSIFHAKPNTSDGDRLELLMLLVEDYENKHHSIEDPDPIQAVKFRMEQMGVDQSELAEITGQPKSKVSEYLNGKRPFSKSFIVSLYRQFSIPAEALLR